MEICFDQTDRKKGFKMHIPQLPMRLKRNEVLTIPEKNFPSPVNREKIEDDSVRFYALDSFGKQRAKMRRVRRKAPPHQPKISRLDKK